MPDSVQSNTRNAAALPAGGAGGTRLVFSSFPCTLKIHTFIVPSNPTFGASAFQVSFVPLGPRLLTTKAFPSTQGRNFFSLLINDSI